MGPNTYSQLIYCGERYQKIRTKLRTPGALPKRFFEDFGKFEEEKDLGNIFHAVLQTYAIEPTSYESLKQALIECSVTGIMGNKLLTLTGRLLKGYSPKHHVNVADIGDIKRQLKAFKRIYEEYLCNYDWEAERSYSTSFDSIALNGKIDLLGTDPENNRIMVIELKSPKKAQEYYDYQLNLYMKMASEASPKFNVFGFVYYPQFLGIRQAMKKVEDGLEELNRAKHASDAQESGLCHNCYLAKFCSAKISGE